MIPVIEIFRSIDGEGKFSGCLASFVRLAGCNLRCRYCDTWYALKLKDGTPMSIDDVIKKVEEFGYKHVTITGGEPLIHDETLSLVLSLLKKGFHVNIETNGSIDVSNFLLDGVTITMDYKTESSGESNAMKIENLPKLRDSDVLKIVMSDLDKKSIKKLLKEIKTRCQIYLSPIFDECKPISLVNTCMELWEDEDTRPCAERCRVQVQLHKIIWDPNQRGV